MNDTSLSIKQTLDTDPEINFINWELNVQDVASTSGRTIAGDQGLLGLVLNTAQWESHALNISVNDEGHQVIAQRYAAPAYIYKQCEPSLIDTLIVGADVSKKHTLNDTFNSNSSKYVNLLWTH